LAWLQPPIAVGPRGHDPRYLNPSTLAAYLTARSERQATIPGTRRHHRGQVDHGAIVGRSEVHDDSLKKRFDEAEGTLS